MNLFLFYQKFIDQMWENEYFQNDWIPVPHPINNEINK